MRENTLFWIDLMDNLTRYEHHALSKVYNLADGHAHQRQSVEQHNIIQQLPSIFFRVEGSSQGIIERDFLASFFELAGQPAAIELNSRFERPLLCYAASISLQIAAFVLQARQLRTGLIEPTFDNLPGILKRVGVDIVPLSEERMFPEPDLDWLASLDVDALVLVLPNNPTGRLMTAAGFEKLLAFCAEKHKLLAVDFCFRFFTTEMGWDQYASALNAGVEFIFIEDSGKTWPSLDLKASVLTVSPSLYEHAFRIHNEILLNVSPFILELVRNYVENSRELGLQATVTNIVTANRQYLRAKLKNTCLVSTNADSTVSVEWLRITDGRSGEELWEQLRDRGVFILPGSHFFWAAPAMGRDCVRVALMRDHATFKAAVDQLVSSLS